MKRLLSLVLGLVAFPAFPVLSSATDVMRVPLSSAVSEIPLSHSAGVTLTFIPTGRRIEKVWLDNPSWVVFDVDGCLAGLGEKNCDSNSAYVTTLHLRRINQMSIEGLQATQISQLTVVTRDTTGLLTISTFRIVPEKKPTYHLVEVVPPAVTTPSQLSALEQLWVERGRNQAVSNGWLTPISRVYARLDKFLILAKTESLPVAAKNAGVSVELVQRLIELGRPNEVLPKLEPAL